MKKVQQLKTKKLEDGHQLFKKIVCPNKGNPVIRACCNDRCKKSALICNGQKCQQCYKSHQKCQEFLNFTSINQKLSKNSFELFADVLKFYTDVIRNAIKQYNQLLALIPNYRFCGEFQRFTINLYKNSKNINSKDISSIKQDLRDGQTQILIEKSKFDEFVNLRKYSKIIQQLKQLRTIILQYKKSFSGQDKPKNNIASDSQQISDQKNQNYKEEQRQDLLYEKVKQVQNKQNEEAEIVQRNVQVAEQSQQLNQIQKETEQNRQPVKQQSQSDQNDRRVELRKLSSQISKQLISLQCQQISNQSQKQSQQQLILKQQLSQPKQQPVHHRQNSIPYKQQQITDIIKDDQEIVKIQSSNSIINSQKVEIKQSLNIQQHLEKALNQEKKELGVKMTESVQKAKHTDSMMIEDKSLLLNENSEMQQSSNQVENLLQNSITQKSAAQNISNNLDKDENLVHNVFVSKDHKENQPVQQKPRQGPQKQEEFSLTFKDKNNKKNVQRGIFK